MMPLAATDLPLALPTHALLQASHQMANNPSNFMRLILVPGRVSAPERRKALMDEDAEDNEDDADPDPILSTFGGVPNSAPKHWLPKLLCSLFSCSSALLRFGG